jgi:hypothetical protein
MDSRLPSMKNKSTTTKFMVPKKVNVIPKSLTESKRSLMPPTPSEMPTLN